MIPMEYKAKFKSQDQVRIDLSNGNLLRVLILFPFIRYATGEDPPNFSQCQSLEEAVQY